MTALMTRTRLDADAARMRRARRGDVVAFAELVERYWRTVVGRFVRQLGDRQEAEDLAQDVFLRLYRARRRYRARAKFSTWLFHVAANVARNAIRSRRRRPCKPLARLCGPQPDDAFSRRYLPDRGDDPARPLERAELAGQVRGALAGARRPATARPGIASARTARTRRSPAGWRCRRKRRRACSTGHGSN